MRRQALQTGAAVALAAAGVAANVAAAASFADAAPYVDFLALVRTALPGVTMALAAGVVVVLGRGGLAPSALIAASFALAAPTLSVGLAQRSAAWVLVGAAGHLTISAIVVVALLFPTGRLGGRMRSTVAALVVLGGGAICVVQTLAYDPGTWGWCRCVENPLAIPNLGPAGYPGFAGWLVRGEIALTAIGLLGYWAARPRPLRGLIGVFAATFTVLALSWMVVDVMLLRPADGAPTAVRGVRDATLVLLPGLYVVGFAQQRPSRAHVADLLLAVRDGVRRSQLSSLVGRAIGDPETLLAWWDPARAGFVDDADRQVDIPDSGVLRVDAEGRPVAVVLADRIDLVDTHVRDSVAQALLLAAENRRLTAELRFSLAQVQASRARILAASDDTQRRIERDLHDGAQQLLISTGIKLNLAAAAAGDGDAALVDALNEAAAELNRALVELRNLASGIAPTSLAHGDLESAVRELAIRSPVPTTVRVTGVDRFDDAAAATAYFVIAESLTNIAKHAGATQSTVDVQLGDPLRLSITDDGHGGATLGGAGTGLRGLADRLDARGGRLEVASGPQGTVVTAAMPAIQASDTPSPVTP